MTKCKVSNGEPIFCSSLWRLALRIPARRPQLRRRQRQPADLPGADHVHALRLRPAGLGATDASVKDVLPPAAQRAAHQRLQVPQHAGPFATGGTVGGPAGPHQLPEQGHGPRRHNEQGRPGIPRGRHGVALDRTILDGKSGHQHQHRPTDRPHAKAGTPFPTIQLMVRDPPTTPIARSSPAYLQRAGVFVDPIVSPSKAASDLLTGHSRATTGPDGTNFIRQQLSARHAAGPAQRRAQQRGCLKLCTRGMDPSSRPCGYMGWNNLYSPDAGGRHGCRELLVANDGYFLFR